MKKYYERYWQENSAQLCDFQIKWPLLSQFIPKNINFKILDYGCGKGKILSEIYKINPESQLYGADISKIALASAAKTVPEAKILLIDDDQKVPLPSNSLDFVISSDVIEHIYDTEKVFYEFNRLLKRGGSLLLSTPYYGVIKNIVIALIGFEKIYDPMTPHIRFYTKNTLVNIVKRFGFEPLQFGRYGRFYPVNNGMYLLAKKVANI
jgi:ubiquinone/menaquinone biosynthesis C-methylase UbiE